MAERRVKKVSEAVAVTRTGEGVRPVGPTDYARLSRPFDHTYRDTRGGATFDYFTGEQAATRLNEEGPGFWSFRVVEHGYNQEADEFWVLGEMVTRIVERDLNDPDKLCYVPRTTQQFGSQKVKRSRRDRTPLDIGFDLKGSATDAMKKCASWLGVGLYLWRKAGGIPTDWPAIPDDGLPHPEEPAPARACTARTSPEETCGAIVAAGEPIMASMREFNRPLCADHFRQGMEHRKRAADDKAARETPPESTHPEEDQDEGSDDPMSPNYAGDTEDPGEPEHMAEPPVRPDEYSGPGADSAPVKATEPPKEPKKQALSTQLAKIMTEREWPCTARQSAGPNGEKALCPAVMRRGTNEEYNGRDIRAEQIAEAALTEFGRILCGRHLYQAREHRRRKSEQILGTSAS